LVLSGPTSDKIAAVAGGGVKTVRCADFDSSVRSACEVAEPGDVVLLSPASTSFDAFKNFEERGERFKNLIINNE